VIEKERGRIQRAREETEEGRKEHFARGFRMEAFIGRVSRGLFAEVLGSVAQKRKDTTVFLHRAPIP
jgi:hypothetical protein